MRIHTNTNTMYLRHKAGCTLRQSLRLWIRWVRHRSGHGQSPFFRHRSWTWTEPYSFEQATWQTWCHSETFAVKAGATNVRDNAILPPTASGEGAGVHASVRTATFASLFRVSLFRGPWED
jgi:hypothetical protein